MITLPLKQIRGLMAALFGRPQHMTIAQIRALTSAPPGPVWATDRRGHCFFQPDPLDNATPDDNVLTLATAGGTRMKRVYSGPKNARWWGLVGDGITDDTQAMRNVLNAFFAQDIEEHFLVPEGVYKITSPIIITIPGYRSKRKFLDFRGYIDCTALTSGIALTIEVGPAVLLSSLVIDGLQFKGGVNQLKLDGGGNGSNQFLYRCRFENLKGHGFSGKGLELTGNIFESDFRAVTFECSNTTAGFPIYLDGADLAGSVMSSLNFYTIETSGGINGIRQVGRITDVLWSGLTILSAGEHGQTADNANNQLFLKCHYEENWKNASSKATGGAGLKLIGNGVVEACFGASNDGHQKWIVDGYASGGDITFIGGMTASPNMDECFRLSGRNAPSSFNVIGGATVNAQYQVPYVHSYAGIARASSFAPIENYFFPTYPSTTINIAPGNYVRVEKLSGNLTITNTAGRNALNGERLTVVLQQADAGTFTVTFTYPFTGPIPPMTTVFGSVRVYEFLYVGGSWQYVGNGA